MNETKNMTAKTAYDPSNEMTSFVNGRVVNARKLNVREKPSATAKILKVVGQEDRLLVDSSFVDAEWCKIRLGPNTFGYSMKKYVKF